jgi:hypothetical protein
MCQLASGLRAARREQEQRAAGERSFRDLTAMRAEVLDDAFVESAGPT